MSDWEYFYPETCRLGGYIGLVLGVPVYLCLTWYGIHKVRTQRSEGYWRVETQFQRPWVQMSFIGSTLFLICVWVPLRGWSMSLCRAPGVFAHVLYVVTWVCVFAGFMVLILSLCRRYHHLFFDSLEALRVINNEKFISRPIYATLLRWKHWFLRSIDVIASMCSVIAVTFFVKLEFRSPAREHNRTNWYWQVIAMQGGLIFLLFFLVCIVSMFLYYWQTPRLQYAGAIQVIIEKNIRREMGALLIYYLSLLLVVMLLTVFSGGASTVINPQLHISKCQSFLIHCWAFPLVLFLPLCIMYCFAMQNIGIQDWQDPLITELEMAPNIPNPVVENLVPVNATDEQVNINPSNTTETLSFTPGQTLTQNVRSEPSTIDDPLEELEMFQFQSNNF